MKVCYIPADDDIIGDVFHDGCSFSSDQSQQDGSLVEVPEEEQFAAASRRATDMAEEVGLRIPEDPLEAQHDLVKVSEAESLNGRRFPVRQRRAKLNGVELASGGRGAQFQDSQGKSAENDVGWNRE